MLASRHAASSASNAEMRLLCAEQSSQGLHIGAGAAAGAGAGAGATFSGLSWTAVRSVAYGGAESKSPRPSAHAVSDNPATQINKMFNNDFMG